MRKSFVAVIAGALGIVGVVFARPAGAVSVDGGVPSSARTPSRGVVVHVVQTTATLSERMKSLPDQWMTRGRVSTRWLVDVRGGIRYQRILGFGATLSDSSAWLIAEKLPLDTRRELIRQLFGADGIRLNYLRLPMGASDFTVEGRPYNYDDVAPGTSDPGLRYFSVAHDLRYIIPTLRQALAINPAIFVFANPWSAPAWMKSNQRSDDLGNTGGLLPVYYGSFAAYFVRFLQAYRSYGVAVGAVAPQNEPGVAEDPGMELPEPDEANFIAGYLRPALASAGMTTQVYGLDLGWDQSPYADALATGPASGVLTGISWHCYYGSPAVMTRLHLQAPRLVQLVNECSPEIRPFSTAEALIGSLRNWASAVALWNLALDPAGGPVEPPGRRCPGCRGIVTVDQNMHRPQPGPTYYQLGQVSRFVRRGAVRIDSNTFVSDSTSPNGFYHPTVGLDDVAFINPDGEKVLVTYNNSPRPIRFAVTWRGQMLFYRQAPGAMTTFTWR